MISECLELMYDFEETSNIYIDSSKRITTLDQLPSSIKRGFEAALVASNHSDWPTRRTQMGSAIFMGSRLLSIGFNHFEKTKPGNRFFKLQKDGRITEYFKPLHAEQSAMVKIKYREYPARKKLVMFVYRTDAQGCPASSFPCQMCQAEISKSNISTVHFIAPGGYYGRWDVRNQ